MFLSIQKFELFVIFFYCGNKKAGVGTSVKSKNHLCSCGLCVLFFMLVRNLSCITSIASLGLLATH